MKLGKVCANRQGFPPHESQAQNSTLVLTPTTSARETLLRGRVALELRAELFQRDFEFGQVCLASSLNLRGVCIDGAPDLVFSISCLLNAFTRFARPVDVSGFVSLARYVADNARPAVATQTEPVVAA